MYNLSIQLLYFSLVKVAAHFNPKAKLMVEGHKQAFDILQNNIDPQDDYLWFHAASLGEFEQGRPLIESIRKSHPKYKIIITFYSPSGYEVRKNYAGADVICYLPPDTRGNVVKFLDIVKPRKAFFIKYEFWANYLQTLRYRGIETYIISAIFRENQVFFKWYGGWYRSLLKCFNHLFVQDEKSKELLDSIGIKNVTVCGDTRFDRVVDIMNQAKQLPLVEKFANHFTLVAGSSWPKDEDIFIEYFNKHSEMKLIIAAHEIHEEHLLGIIAKLKRPYVRYSAVTIESVAEADCLIIDCFGLLSSIYRYGQVAYIGGGFGVGIHNVTEAAVYSVPVIFGPNYEKFREARDLITCGGGFSIADYSDFEALMDRFISDKSLLADSGKKAGDYIYKNIGATQTILKKVL